MLANLVDALVQSKNEAADDVLVEALRLGTEAEKSLVLGALLRRATSRGLSNAIALYETLPASCQKTLLQNIGKLHPSLRESGRSPEARLALPAIKLIAAGRQGRLTYILSEALHAVDESISRSAMEAMLALSRWVVSEARKLQTGGFADAGQAATSYRQLMEQRPEIEHAVARAINVHRGKHGQDLLRAALLLADWPGSETLAILNTTKHGGQNAIIRRLQQAPESENVEAFVLGATHGGLRGHFGIVFSHIVEPATLDALLRRTHWLKDQQLQLCMHQVSRGAWWDEAALARNLLRRDDDDVGRIAEWIAGSALHDVMQDEKLNALRVHLARHVPGRLRLLRLAMRRPRGSSVNLIREFLRDPDERLVRLAAREIVRRRPADFENMLMQAMATAAPSVRRVIARSVGQVGFENFWERFDRLEQTTRRSAGQALFKVLPDSIGRLERRLRSGPVEQRIKAMTMAQELGLGDALGPLLAQLCHDPHPKLRSKAVSLLGETQTVPPDVLLDKVLNDNDPRVRANAIEVLETRKQVQYVPLLAKLARSSNSRERANAIKALHRMRVSTASAQLGNMLLDDRPEHRISALWALRQIGWWQMLHNVGRLRARTPTCACAATPWLSCAAPPTCWPSRSSATRDEI